MAQLVTRCVTGLLAIVMTLGSALPISASETTARSSSTALHHCKNTPVSVQASRATDSKQGCAAARDVISFMQPYGVTINEKLIIEMVTQTPEIGGVPTLGAYSRADQRILVLDFASLQSIGNPFPLPIDSALHRAVIAHEFTHAVTDQHFHPEPPPVLAQEYVAAVVSLATLPDDDRRRLLESVPGSGFADESEMSLTYFLLNPIRFWLAAYRHFERPEAGVEFLSAVLAGEALRTPDQEYR